MQPQDRTQAGGWLCRGDCEQRESAPSARTPRSLACETHMHSASLLRGQLNLLGPERMRRSGEARVSAFFRCVGESSVWLERGRRVGFNSSRSCTCVWSGLCTAIGWAVQCEEALRNGEISLQELRFLCQSRRFLCLQPFLCFVPSSRCRSTVTTSRTRRGEFRRFEVRRREEGTLGRRTWKARAERLRLRFTRRPCPSSSRDAARHSSPHLTHALCTLLACASPCDFPSACAVQSALCHSVASPPSLRLDRQRDSSCHHSRIAMACRVISC